MCTVSAMRLPGEVIRVAVNRDEAVTRATGLPPVVRRYGGLRAVMPIDPVSEGTWVGANEAGIVMTLLNYNAPGATAAVAPRSRGVIIPSMLGLTGAREIAGAATGLAQGSFGAFRLVVVDREAWGEVLSDGAGLRVRVIDAAPDAMLFTSSGLGDHLVERPRRRLFERMISRRGASAAVQDAFHRHGWAESPHLSVRMRRAEARTVSTTVVEVGPEGVCMSYRAVDDEHGGDGVEHVVELSSRVLTCG
jgi:hypothetical protein